MTSSSGGTNTVNSQQAQSILTQVHSNANANANANASTDGNNATSLVNNLQQMADQDGDIHMNRAAHSNSTSTVDELIVHLNIEEHHYYITREQLLALPESLLLCLFPNGVFMTRDGQVITSLTSNDEVYVYNFSHVCFEYIMDIYTQATEDLVLHPVPGIYDKYSNGINNAIAAVNNPDIISNPSASNTSNGSTGFFHHLASTISGSSLIHNQHPHSSNDNTDVLHLNPSIIVLREDLDYYCIPLIKEIKGGLDIVMQQVKIAAGSYLSKQQSIFDGLYCSNRVKSGKLGVAEQHLMDMLCSSGLERHCDWGNRTQELGKTVISSLSLIRLKNETTQYYRDLLEKAYRERISSIQNTSGMFLLSPQATSNSSLDLSPSTSNISVSTNNNNKRRSRWADKLSNVRSRSQSRNKSKSRLGNNSGSHYKIRSLYDLVPKPDINPKLLLFWKKPARKCWWGNIEIDDLEIELPIGSYYKKDGGGVLVVDGGDGINIVKVKVPVRIHIRRVWTLEVSIVGV
ncbi:related to Growth regulation protein [Saccharomycodes ludwigii]|uniref:Related to Growth regulation protein n=1 Tax=Saccharomycodes ludwigii TaxID=36035 RepID=A0A376B5B7_9ASCO|nr:related to Growth regulation protein [Saccharomycodes ludwigii]